MTSLISTMVRWLICSIACLNFSAALTAQSFKPYAETYQRLVQSVNFSAEGSTMYFALPHKEYRSALGFPMSDQTPRLAIYQAMKDGDAWGPPELLPFSGQYKDYEPSLSPNGEIMFFNSNRPERGKEPLEKNNIWFAEKRANGWSKPKFLRHINTSDLEESYPAISATGKLVYVAEKTINSQSEYAIYETTFDGESTKPGTKIEIIDIPKGCGDPWISPDGTYLIFTKFDEANWTETCDLYISFNENNQWTQPEAIAALNSNGPDFAAAVSWDEQWIYYRKNHQFVKIAFQPILKAYRSKL